MTRRRRAKGEGQLQRLGPGRWRARITVDGRERSAVRPTQAEARTWLDAAKAEIAAGRVTRSGASTLASLRDDYLAELERRGCTSSTVANAGSHLRQVLERWGDVRVDAVDGPLLAGIVRDMAALGWAPATIRNRVDRITSMTRYAMERGWTAPRPLPVRRPRVTLASRPDLYEPEEVAALLEAARRTGDPRQLGRVAAAFYAGLRAGELFRLRRCDVDPGRGLLVVPVRSATDRPKGGVERVVPVPAELLAALAACPGGPDALLLAEAEWGSPWQLRDRLGDVWAAAGVQGGVHLHRLRHSWCTVWADHVPLLTLCAAAGWAAPQTALRYYHFGLRRSWPWGDAFWSRFGGVNGTANGTAGAR